MDGLDLSLNHWRIINWSRETLVTVARVIGWSPEDYRRPRWIVRYIKGKKATTHPADYVNRGEASALRNLGREVRWESDTSVAIFSHHAVSAFGWVIVLKRIKAIYRSFPFHVSMIYVLHARYLNAYIASFGNRRLYFFNSYLISFFVRCSFLSSLFLNVPFSICCNWRKRNIIFSWDISLGYGNFVVNGTLLLNHDCNNFHFSSSRLSPELEASRKDRNAKNEQFREQPASKNYFSLSTGHAEVEYLYNYAINDLRIITHWI